MNSPTRVAVNGPSHSLDLQPVHKSTRNHDTSCTDEADANQDSPPCPKPLSHAQSMSEGKMYGENEETVSLTQAGVVGVNSTGEESKPRTPQSRPWKTTWMRLGPLAGILCMWLAFLSVFASLGVLKAADNAPISDWKYQPATYIAILTAVSNQAIRYASLQGVAIAWWTRALRGSTVARLHNDWHAGTTLFSALVSRRKISLLGVACIFSTLVAVDGPLLQRASSVVTTPIVGDQVSMNVTLAPEVPTDFSGDWAHLKATNYFGNLVPAAHGSTPNNVVIAQSKDFWHVSQPYAKKVPMTGFVKGCPGVCRAKLKAPALTVTSCTAHVIPVNYTQAYISSEDFALRLGFLSYMNLVVDSQDMKEKINLVTGFATTTDCIGVFNYTACTLESAVGEYEALITNDTVTLLSSQSPTILALANNTRVDQHAGEGQNHYSTLAGIVAEGLDLFRSSVLFDTEPGGQLGVVYDGSLLYQFAIRDFESYCSSYADPSHYILGQLNEIMFRTGVYVANPYNSSLLSTSSSVQRYLDPGMAVNTTVTGELIGNQSVYRTNFWYFLAAALVELTCIALIANLLGLVEARSVCIVFAIGNCKAPLLADCNSNCSGHEIAKAIVYQPLRYGATGSVVDKGGVSEYEARQIAFASPEVVYRPLDHYRFEV